LEIVLTKFANYFCNLGVLIQRSKEKTKLSKELCQDDFLVAEDTVTYFGICPWLPYQRKRMRWTSYLGTRIRTWPYPDKRIQLLPCQLEEEPIHTAEFSELGIVVYVVENWKIQVRWEADLDLILLLHGEIPIEGMIRETEESAER
jgi:hypothetical protein